MSESFGAPLVTALVAAISGILTSIYAGINGARNARKLAALEADLARHKETTLEYMKAYLTLELEEHNRALEACKQIVHPVQLFRETLRRFLLHPDSFSPEVLSKEVAELSRNISEAYASNLLFLNKDSTRVAHALKNDCISAADILDRYMGQRQGQLLRKLEDLQDSITTRQADLRVYARQYADLLIADTKSQIDKRAPNGK